MVGDSLPAVSAPRVRSGAARPAPVWLDATLVLTIAVAALAAVTWLGLDLSSWPDWTIEAVPGVDALLDGRFGEFLRAAPVYGGSLLLRAPFMAVTRLWQGGGEAVYRASAAPCIAALAALGLWLAHQMARRDCGLLARTTTVVLCIANPLVIPALQLGHPEELLGAVLCVVAVLCARRGHAVWGGVLVGAAIANQPWGVLAAGPMLIALTQDRRRAGIVMVLTTAAILAPFVLVDDGGFSGQAAAVGVNSGGIFNPWQLWWFLGPHRSGTTATLRIAPRWLGGLGHTVPIAIMPPITLAYLGCARRRLGAKGLDVFLLLALLLLLRCALDPWNISYYALPFLTALLAWETNTYDRPPLITLVASFMAWLVLQETAVWFGNDQNTLAMLYTIAVLPAIAAIAYRLLAPGSIKDLGRAAFSGAGRNAVDGPRAIAGGAGGKGKVPASDHSTPTLSI